MSVQTPHVVILGGGPAGVGGAYQLRRLGRATVTLFEQGATAGGNAGSFTAASQSLDYGSHRLHPACDPDILRDIQAMLGDDLLDRPRHGRIRLRGRWIHFPLQPHDLLLRLDPGFAMGTVRDMVRKVVRRSSAVDAPSFASVLRDNLGPTICDHFYFPYAKKIWGRDPDQLSAIQARRRVSAGSFVKLIKKVLRAVPGLKPPGAGRFYYPRQGYGQISDAYATAATEAGARLAFDHRVTSVRRSGAGWKVGATGPSGAVEEDADLVWSTVPITLLAKLVQPAPPAEVLDAAAGISYRSMILVYLTLPVDQFTEFDAHYFPGGDVGITRLSEPKNYTGLGVPTGSTVLCAELPCQAGDEYWSMSDEDLGRVVADDLTRAGIPLPVAATEVFTRRLPAAYPIYLQGYEQPFGVLDRWADELPDLVTYGRQGLFAHDNTHHALFMAYSAANCLEGGVFNRDRWTEYRGVFETHVVED